MVDAPTFPVLYLLPRTDMASMNPGKAMAHAAHAANAFVFGMEARIADHSLPVGSPLYQLYTSWKNSTTQGFGTTIVLQSTDDQSCKIVDACLCDDSVNSGWCVDPTYPYAVSSEIANLIPTTGDTLGRIPNPNGTVTMFREERTCAWVFGDKNSFRLKLLLDCLQLHP